MSYLAWLIFICAAILEVGGDAFIRKGIYGGHMSMIFLGILTLGSYGIMVNTVKWDFSKLLGVYVAVFALTSVLFGHFIFNEKIAGPSWIGLTMIIIGGIIIQVWG
jgi:small multidrug resistance family-3 protein